MSLLNKLAKTTIIMVLCSMTSTNNIFATYENAPGKWSNPEVSKNITENILYLPISDKVIRSIDVKDSGEELVDLLEINNSRIKPLSTFSSKYRNNYEGYSRIRRGLYERLVRMLQILPQDVGIAYFEGFRPLHKQKEYFDNKLKETLVAIKDKEEAYNETAKLVSPFIDNIPTHCTGAAIDITLFRITDSKPKLIDMGQFDVIFGVNNQQETFSENTTGQQRENRLLLIKAATEAGLVNYGYEWWHYSYGDKAWAYVKGEKYALYGLAPEDKNNPILSIDKNDYLKQF